MTRRTYSRAGLLSASLDIVIVIVSMYVAFFVRFDLLAGINNLGTIWYHLQWATAMAPVLILTLSINGASDYRAAALGPFQIFWRVIAATCITVGLLIACAFALKLVDMSRLLLLLFWTVLTILLYIKFFVFHSVLRRMRAEDIVYRSVVLVGSGNNALSYNQGVENDPNSTYKIVGSVGTAQLGATCQLLGGYDDLARIVDETKPDEIVVALDVQEQYLINDVLYVCEHSDCRVSVVPAYYSYLSGDSHLNLEGGVPVINFNNRWITNKDAANASALRRNNLAHADAVSSQVNFKGDTLYLRYGKRFLDIVLSLLAIILTLPINFVIALVTYFDVGRPIFFGQLRTGKNLKPFKLWKFRNMTNETDRNGNLLPPEERITKWGLFVRRHSLDELLNFWSVLKGDMSLIGPRPLPVEFNDRMTERHRQRYLVRPGLENPFIDMETTKKWRYAHARFENDIQYVETVSFKTDVMQAFRLVAMVFGKRRTTSSTGTDAYFVGYDHEGIALSNGNLHNPDVYKVEIEGVGNPLVGDDR